MYETPPLLTIRRPTRRPSAAQIATLNGVPSAVATDAMDGRGALAGSIRHLDGGRYLPVSVVGPALTAWSGAADLLALHACKAFVTPGDVVIAGVDGHQGCAVFGDALGGMMKNAGVAGVVTDGPIRDTEGLMRLGMPVWCTGSVSSTPYENGPGRIGLPVQIGGQRVDTGDLIVADLDGVVAIPFDEIDRVAERCATIMQLEQDGEKAVADGLVMPETYEELLKSDRINWVE
ncbi:MAG: RraA family protein [Rhodobacteraceae bacterium]|nr:MAG: RraA family protein [Paracoccaceae bacterium]